RGDARDRGAVVPALGRAAGEGRVEIDDVDARHACRGEPGRHLPGRAVVHLRALTPPLLQAHGGAVHQIDSGEDQHRGGPSLDQAATKLRNSARPAAWLFSGWNWQPNTLSRPTAQENSA